MNYIFVDEVQGDYEYIFTPSWDKIQWIIKKKGFFKEQNAGFSAQIHSVTLTKTWFFKKGMFFMVW